MLNFLIGMESTEQRVKQFLKFMRTNHLEFRTIDYPKTDGITVLKIIHASGSPLYYSSGTSTSKLEVCVIGRLNTTELLPHLLKKISDNGIIQAQYGECNRILKLPTLELKLEPLEF
jgi:hypothetical protein